MIHAVSSRLPGRRTIVLLAVVLVALVIAFTLVEPPASTTTSPGRSEAGSSRNGSASVRASGTQSTGTTDAVAPQPAPEATSKALGGPVDASREANVSEAAGGAAGTGGFAGDYVGAPDGQAASSSTAPPSIDLKVIRTGALGLKVKRGTFDEAYTAAQHAATGLGGYVVTASRSGSGRSARFGTLTIRIPGDRFDDAMDELRGIRGAKVERLDVSSQDVTEEYVDTKSRLRHDRAVEGRLLALVAKAEDVDEVLAVQARLDQVQEEIEVSKGRLTYLDRMTEMTTIDIAIREPGARSRHGAERKHAGPEWGVHDSLGRSAHRFVGNVNRFVVWLGGALPAILALALVALLVRMRLARRSSTDD